jgi:hypothetical protein
MYAVDIENFVEKGCKRQELTAYYDSFKCESDGSPNSFEYIPAKRCTTSLRWAGKPFRSFKVLCVDPPGPIIIYP